MTKLIKLRLLPVFGIQTAFKLNALSSHLLLPAEKNKMNIMLTHGRMKERIIQCMNESDKAVQAAHEALMASQQKLSKKF